MEGGWYTYTRASAYTHVYSIHKIYSFFFFSVGTMGAWRENTHTISLMTLYSKKGFNRISKKVSTLYSNRLYGPNN